MKTTITRLIFAAAAICAASGAVAADLRQPSYKAPPYVAPSYNSWNGFYIGLNGGYSWGWADWQSPPLSMIAKGYLIGATLGYNFQTGTWVWGVEGDLDYANVKGSTDCGFGFTCETAMNWFGTARARIGYGGWNNFLPYITGGAAFGGVKATNNLLGTSASSTRFGWTAGVGVEYAMMTNWSVKLEYLYADLGKFDCGTACSPVTPANVSLKQNIVRAGVNYRF